MQAEIDGGMRVCEPCDKPGWHTFCGDCGRRYVGADLPWQECRKCRTIVATEWCPVCGTRLKTDIQRKLDAGEITLDAMAAAAARADAAYQQARDQRQPGDANLSPAARAALTIFGRS